MMRRVLLPFSHNSKSKGSAQKSKVKEVVDFSVVGFCDGLV